MASAGKTARNGVGLTNYGKVSFVSRDGRRTVEIKPSGQLDSALWGPLSQYFSSQSIAFEVVANEAIFERQQEAENWLEGSRSLP